MASESTATRMMSLLALAPPLFGAALMLGRLAVIFSGREPRGEELPVVLGEIRALADALQAGDTSGWIHGANLGYPAGLFAPVLPTLCAALWVALGASVLGAAKLCIVVALVALPLTTAVGARLGGLSAWRAGLAGYGAAMIASTWEFGAGVDGVFRAGLFSQAFAVALLPLACGLGVRAVQTGSGAFLAIVAGSAVMLCEPILLVAVLLAWGVALAGARQPFALRNAAALMLGVVLTTAFFWLPALVHADVYGGGPRQAPGAVVPLVSAVVALLSGDAVDAGRPPWLTGLALLGLGLSLWRARVLRVRDARLGLSALLGATLLWILCAPPGLPDDALPAGRVLVLSQLLMVTLAGVGLVDVVEGCAELLRLRVHAPALRAGVAFVAGLSLVVLGVAVDLGAEGALRPRVGCVDTDDPLARHSLDEAMAAIRDAPAPRGRVAAAGPVPLLTRALPMFDAGAPPLWLSVGPAVASSPNAWLAHRDDVRRFRELYGVQFLLVPSDVALPERNLLVAGPAVTLHGAPASSMWLSIVAGDSVVGDLHAWRDAVRSWASQEERPTHLLYTREGAAAPPPATAAGRVSLVEALQGSGWFSANVLVDADAPKLVALKESYSPLWRATVDGVAVPLLRVSPDLPALAVPPGQHLVRLEAVRPMWHWLLLLLAPGLALWSATRARRG